MSASRLKPFVLPIAIVLGLLLHSLAVMVMWLIPYVIFAILLLNFSAVDLRRLVINRLDIWTMAFQALVSIAGYALLRAVGVDIVLAEGWLMAVLCPVASSVVVVAAAIGADRNTTTGYTIYGNLLVALLAPIFFTFIASHSQLSFIDSAWLIFKKIASVIALPYFIALLMQHFAPRATHAISRYKGWAFPLWAFALFVTLGQTIDYIMQSYRGNEANILWLAVIAIAVCAIQFATGKRIGRRYGEAVAGGQMLGQKNTAIGIWMASVYLSPLASVVLAFYSIAQNIFNSYQIWRYQHTQGGGAASSPT